MLASIQYGITLHMVFVIPKHLREENWGKILREVKL